MIKIEQTSLGGIDRPISEQGNCFQACLASILEMPLEQAFDCIPYDQPQDHTCGEKFEGQLWYVEFEKWLASFGLGCIYLEWKPTTPAITQLTGYHIAEVKSSTLKNGETHCVVIRNGELAHDPNPNSKVNGDDLLGVYILVPLDIAKSRKSLPIIHDEGKIAVKVDNL